MCISWVGVLVCNILRVFQIAQFIRWFLSSIQELNDKFGCFQLTFSLDDGCLLQFNHFWHKSVSPSYWASWWLPLILWCPAHPKGQIFSGIYLLGWTHGDLYSNKTGHTGISVMIWLSDCWSYSGLWCWCRSKDSQWETVVLESANLVIVKLCRL